MNPPKRLRRLPPGGTASGLEPGRAVSVEFTAPLFFDAAGQRVTA